MRPPIIETRSPGDTRVHVLRFAEMWSTKRRVASLQCGGVVGDVSHKARGPWRIGLGL